MEVRSLAGGAEGWAPPSATASELSVVRGDGKVVLLRHRPQERSRGAPLVVHEGHASRAGPHGYGVADLRLLLVAQREERRTNTANMTITNAPRPTNIKNTAGCASIASRRCQPDDAYEAGRGGGGSIREALTNIDLHLIVQWMDGAAVGELFQVAYLVSALVQRSVRFETYGC